MRKVWLTTSSGFSVVEVLLAVTIFAMLSSAVVGALIYGRSSTAGSGDRVRANYVAEEGIEAVRNYRNASYTNLVNGTYGLQKSGGVWTLSGSSDVTDIFTRSVTIGAGSDANRKIITSHVSWSGADGSGTTDIASQLANWSATLPKYWSNASQYATLNPTGTIAAYKVDTAGSYAYVIRKSATGPNLFVVNISNPSAPVVSGSLTLAGTPTNISVSGNYAYISNSSSTGELQIVNIATPTAPALSGTYNATGSAGGLGVYAIGTTVYLTRAANSASDEFVIVNAANPASPTRVAGYGLSVAMNEVYVNGTTAYVASGSDTQEVLVINLAASPTLTLGTAINLSGTTDALTISGNGSTMVVGQGTTLYTINAASNALAPTVSGSLTLPGTVNDADIDATHNYAMVGTSSTTGEFQVVNINTLSTPAILKSVDMTGAFILTGVAYSSTYDIAIGASSNTAGEVVVFGPN